jgi:crotonobetainyl-CoA:carnitine CoA-transferase CaiB-like acyl-CoA transferase
MEQKEVKALSKGALKGVRVIDFSRYIAGPYCARLLAYLGADVIRVEKPSGGEDRFVTPLYGDTSALLAMTGLGKRGLTLDLKLPDSRVVVERLVKAADVVIVNMPAKVLKRMGLDYDSLKSIKRDIILTTQTCFGHDGPWSDWAGFDGIAQVMSGSAFMSGTEEEPRRSAAPYADYTTAVLGAFGTMAALRQRDRDGEGQHVQTSLLGSAIGVFSSAIIEQETLGTDRRPDGNRGQTTAPTDIFKTRDGSIITQVVGNGLFARIAKVVGKPEWIDDIRFQSDESRAEHRNFICETVGEWASKFTTEKVLEQLSDLGVPCGPVLGVTEVASHPQVDAMSFVESINPVSSEGKIHATRVPLDFSSYKSSLGQPPSIGEHSEEVLKEIGFNDSEIRRFRNSRVI